MNWFKYLQLKRKFKEDKKNFGIETSMNELDMLWSKGDRNKISKIYKILLRRDLESETIKDNMVRWAQDVGHTITYENWQKAWRLTNRFTASQDLKENYMKVSYRWYLTPLQLKKMYKLNDELCWKCRKDPGSLYHMWWSCHKVRNFWGKIHQTIQKIFKTNFEMKPEVYLLNMCSILNNNIINKHWRVMLYMVTGARLVLAKKWKDNALPTLEDWLLKLFELREMDRLTYMMRNEDQNELQEEWSPVVKFWGEKYDLKEDFLG